jgi:hypothetical protein
MIWNGMEWINVIQKWAQWRATITTEVNLWIPQNFDKFFNSCTNRGFSRRAQLYGVSR